ncbi:MAG: GspG family T2SS major pseudopilin variant LspG [Tatlockia sp.]|jgi:general secretion pathway protein G
MNKQSGFSLIEIMVVVVILGILASIVVPKIINRPDEARAVKAKQDVLAIQNALDLFKLDNGFYPSTDQGILALVEKPDSNPEPSDWKQYLKSLPKDPWGRDYLYLNPGEHSEVDVFTFGASGQPGGEGKNALIGNWNVR